MDDTCAKIYTVYELHAHMAGCCLKCVKMSINQLSWPRVYNLPAARVSLMVSTGNPSTGPMNHGNNMYEVFYNVQFGISRVLFVFRAQ